MPDKGTNKKLTKVGGEEPSSASAGRETAPFVVTEESKTKAKTFRIIAVIAWVLAIGAEAAAIVLLFRPPIEMVWLIVLIGVDLVFAVIGSLLWKKANRFDPASRQDKARFFFQNQLGAIVGVIAFLPLVILIFTNKDLDKKQKGILGSIAVVALVVAGIAGIDFNPPSQEQYAEQTAQVQDLTGGANSVFWTKSGTSYHIYSDCSYINTARTDEIFQGTVAKARELKNISDLCDRCAARAEKERGLTASEAAAVDVNKGK